VTEEQIRQMDLSTAYHEAGHAWILYWHFLRKGYCEGITISIESDKPSLEDALGLTRPRGLNVSAWNWNHYTCFCAAGDVSAGIFAVKTGFVPRFGRREPWTWENWAEQSRRSLEEAFIELQSFFEDRGDVQNDEDDAFEREFKAEFSGDFSGWYWESRKLGLDASVASYWKEWLDANKMIRAFWGNVEALAQALFAQRRLSENEVRSICEEER